MKQISGWPVQRFQNNQASAAADHVRPGDNASPLPLLLKLGISLLVIGSCSLNTAAKTAHSANFPGPLSSLTSPDGKYCVINVDSSKDESIHSLFLKNNTNKSKKKFFTYVRNVDVLWSPDSKHIAVNDRLGSNVASALLFQVSKPSEPVDLCDLIAAGNAKNKASLTKNDHVYFSTHKWLSEKKLEIYVSGHGDEDPGGFTLVYEYTINGRSRLLKRLEEEGH